MVRYKHMQVALLGLSGMGKIVLEKLLVDGHEIILWSSVRDELERVRSEKAEFVVSQKLKIVHSVEELQNLLRKPVIVWVSQPVGEPTETLLSQISHLVGAGDVVIDGGKSNYKDTDRRSQNFEKSGVKFLGIGVAGGVHAIENGCSLMVGGNFEAYQYIAPILESLIKPEGIDTYFGAGGAGHFVAMVHAGVESAMLQSVSEGLSLLKKSDYRLDLVDAANTWQGGGTVSSFVLDMAMDALDKDRELSQTDGNLSTSDGVRWMIDDAKLKGVRVPVTAQAFDFAARSQYDKLIAETFVAKLIKAMRKEIEG